MEKGRLFKTSKIVVASVGIVYTLFTILAVISTIRDLKNISTTAVNFSSVLSLVWFNLAVIISLAITYIGYNIKNTKTIFLELLIGIALILNVIVNIIVVGTPSSLYLLNFVLPCVILLHSLFYLFMIYKSKVYDKLKDIFKAF